MKKAIACLLALPLALAACGAQGADSAQSQPATETEQTTETAQKTTAPPVGTAGKLRGIAYTLYTNTGPVSYTHLDVYKRQPSGSSARRCLTC